MDLDNSVNGMSQSLTGEEQSVKHLDREARHVNIVIYYDNWLSIIWTTLLCKYAAASKYVAQYLHIFATNATIQFPYI